MKIFYTFFLTFTMVSAFAQQSPYFASYPALSPDAKILVFSFEGDLWKSTLGQSDAVRLTAMQGDETSAKISPDGRWLAFSSTQFGNNDVYLMPVAGGDIKQLTFHDSNDEVDSWDWDSNTIYFTSGRYNNYAGYSITTSGGTPKRLFGNYFNTVHHVVQHPITRELFFNDTWESKTFAHRKRYKGAYNPDIQSYNPGTKKYTQYTDYNGKDFWTSIDRNGTIYFVSDEANDEYNLYTFDNGKKTKLTNFETSIKRPSVSANGEKIAFERDYRLYVYDVVTKKTELLQFNTFRNNILGKEQDFDVKNLIERFDISPDGKKLAFISRGELFVSDHEGKFIKKLEKTNERALEVKWLKDNRTLLFNQTSHGFQNLYTISADGSGNLKPLTQDLRNNRSISLSHDRSMAVYLSGRDEVRILNLTDLTNKTIAKDEIWGFQNSVPSISPDNQFVLFTAIRNFEQDIFVHNLQTKKTINLTNTGVTEASPVWSPDGRYIYFASSRTKPSYPYGMQDPRLYRVALENMDAPFRLNKFDELFKIEEKKVTDKKEPTKIESQVPWSIVIDAEGFMRRLEQVGPMFGSQGGPQVFQKADKTYIYYSTNHDQGKSAVYRTILEDFENSKTEKVTDGLGFEMVDNGKPYMLTGGAIHKYNAETNKPEKLDISYKFRRNLSGEFNQMFYETWANLDENFYDENMHGLDWKKTGEQYSAYLPYVNNRQDLRILLNDLLGELNSSHMGFNSAGSEEQARLAYRTLETGIVFDEEDPFRVSHIIKGSNADHKGINILKGDRLLKVNGEIVNQDQDRNYYFTKPSLDSEMTITLERANKTFDVRIHPQSSVSLRANLYDDWIETNQKRVDTRSKDRIAYVYMKNMGASELESFLIDMVSEAATKDGLILDLRYNTGGNVHDAVLNFLSQKPYLQWKYRGGAITPQPNFGPAAKPMVLLINEQSLSDAEMTAEGFKALKLGKVIGTETYRWIIFTSAKSLVDGSSYRLPAWGCYTLDGKNIEKAGVTPDIFVKNTFKDRLEGKDPQLDRAIDEILTELK